MKGERTMPEGGPQAGADDERIAAWIDGMLDEKGAAAMSELAASDETLTARAQRLRHIDALVRSAVPAEDEIPPALVERLGLAPQPAAPRTAQILSLDEVRARRRAPARGPVGQPRWQIAAQVALVLGLGVSLAMGNGSTGSGPSSPASYRALGHAAPPGAALPAVNALVVFAPGTDLAAARAIAGRAGARLVGEPNEAGAWKLAVSPVRRDAVLQALRADPAVTMAEPVDGVGR